MPQEPLIIEDTPGSKPGQRILRLKGSITISNLFDFQTRVRTDTSKTLIIDFTNVPYIDSAGIGALVGAYVTHQKDGRSLALIGVPQRIHDSLKVAHVEQFFRFYDSLDAVDQAIAS